MEIPSVTDLPPVKETPRNVATVILPEIVDPALEVGLRLGMHTDSINTFLKTLYTEPLSRELKIEGRILDGEQEERLHGHPRFRFYMGSRLTRESFFFRSDLGIDANQAASLATSPFEPASLAEEVGYETGFIDMAYFLDLFLKGRPNDLVGIIGGVNQFRIGSDTLSSDQIAEIVEKLRSAWTEQEQLYTAIAAALPAITPGFTSVPVSLLSGLIANNQDKKNPLKIIDSKNIFPNPLKGMNNIKYNPK